MNNLDINYSTSRYDWLCFKHAVEQANLGVDVNSDVVEDKHSYLGSMFCPRCSEEIRKKVENETSI